MNGENGCKHRSAPLKRDALIMAAAPELYECLREAVGEFCHECEDTRIESCRGRCFVAKWRDALSKCERGAEL